MKKNSGTVAHQKFNPVDLDFGSKEKINLSFYFHISFRYHKRLYEGNNNLHETFCGTAKVCKYKRLS